MDYSLTRSEEVVAAHIALRFAWYAAADVPFVFQSPTIVLEPGGAMLDEDSVAARVAKLGKPVVLQGTAERDLFTLDILPREGPVRGEDASIYEYEVADPTKATILVLPGGRGLRVSYHVLRRALEMYEVPGAAIAAGYGPMDLRSGAVDEMGIPASTLRELEWVLLVTRYGEDGRSPGVLLPHRDRMPPIP